MGKNIFEFITVENVAIPSKPGQRLQFFERALVALMTTLSQSLPNQVNDFNRPGTQEAPCEEWVSQSLPNQVNDFNDPDEGVVTVELKGVAIPSKPGQRLQ